MGETQRRDHDSVSRARLDTAAHNGADEGATWFRSEVCPGPSYTVHHANKSPPITRSWDSSLYGPSTLERTFRLAYQKQNNAQYHEAEELFRRALKQCEVIFGLQDEATAGTLVDLAWVLAEQEKFLESELLCRRAIPVIEGDMPPESTGQDKLLSAVGVLSLALWRQNKYAEAEGAARRALHICRSLHGSDAEETLEYTSILARILGSSGGLQEEERTLRDAIDISNRLPGIVQQRRLHLSDMLARNLQSQSRYIEAVALYEGMDDPTEIPGGFSKELDILEIRCGRAHILDRQGRHDEAARVWSEVLSERIRLLGREDPSTLEALSDLASSLEKQGDYTQAEQLYRQALDASLRVLGPEHVATFIRVYYLANVLSTSGQPPIGPITDNCITFLARMLDAQGKHVEAAAVLCRSD
ncbi:hypothetical protein BJX62DRAFT_252946 [Aspergillus germanicus]